MFPKRQLWTTLSATLPSSFSSTTRRLMPLLYLSSSPDIVLIKSRFSSTSHHLHDHFLENPLKFSWKNFSAQTARDNNSTCWNCNAQPPQKLLPFLVCESCRAVQPVDPFVNYFDIFGLEKNYEIQDQNLERKYKDWQKQLHPDLVHSKSQKEREFAAEQSARVIDAYRTLSNPRLRAIYILKLEGIDINEEETVSEPQLLAEIMEIREAVEEAPDSKALTGIQSLMREKLLQWSNSFSNAFQSRKFEDAIACIRRMTYYDRVNEEIVKRL